MEGCIIKKPQFRKQLPIKIVSYETTNDYKAKTYKEIINFRKELNDYGKCIWNRQNDISKHSD